MALPLDDIEELLFKHDIEHSVGSVDFALRRNLLCKITGSFTKNAVEYLEITKFQPEGYGYRERLRFHTSMPEIAEHSKSLLLWNADSELPPQNAMLWLLDLEHEQFLSSSLELGYIYDPNLSG